MRKSIALPLVAAAFLACFALLWLPLRAERRLRFATALISEEDGVCAPFTVDRSEQCEYVQRQCSSSDTASAISYLEGYFCSSPGIRPLTFAGLVFALLFLFSFISIAASDFFCPNLSTIAGMLGLDENIAGVTFLAFGNGSPDLFSTFSAMRSGSGSLAVGELLGAGTFVVSVVAGSMCLIKPFRVNRVPFLRDAIFYTIAVAALLAFLSDGVFVAWEAAFLIGIYAAYVLTVVVGTLWERQREKAREREALIRGEFDGTIEPYVDDPESDDPFGDEPPSPQSFQRTPGGVGRDARNNRALSAPPNPELLGSSLASTASRASSPSPSLASSDSALVIPRAHHNSMPPAHRNSMPPRQRRNLPSFSLLGAVEFRNVVHSLQRESSGLAPPVYDEALFSAHVGGHYHTLPHRRDTGRIMLRTPVAEESPNPFDEAFTGFRLVKATSPVPIPDDQNAQLPSISIIPPGTPEPSPPATPLESPVPLPRRSRRSYAKHLLIATSNTLFPTLHSLPEKDWSNRILSVIAFPAVLALTLTLPVVVAREMDEMDDRKDDDGTLSDEEPFNHWLMAVQCVLGPIFCVFIVLGNNPWGLWFILGSALVGLVLAVLVVRFSAHGRHPVAKLVRCFLGFGVAIVWIAAIADEVVRVLLALGVIFGLSDAIIGLTVFALGNSLADFVANWTVASMGSPIMGLAACYASPMLNILLGLGVAGTVVTQENGAEGYGIVFSNTLIVSAIGLLAILVATLIVVPWNGYWLTRRWGASLVAGYFVIMMVNILVELKL